MSAIQQALQMARIERSSPPGVSSWMTRACAPLALAR